MAEPDQSDLHCSIEVGVGWRVLLEEFHEQGEFVDVQKGYLFEKVEELA